MNLTMCAMMAAALLAVSAVLADAPEQDGPALLARLRQQYDQGSRTLTVPPGVYVFPAGEKAGFTLRGWTDATIDATGVTFLTNHGGVTLDRCRNVIIQGVTVDNDPAPLMQGVIAAIDPVARTLDVTLDPRYYLPPAAGISRTGARFTEFYAPDGRDPVASEWESSWGYQPLGGNSYRVSLLNNRMFVVGDHPDSVAVGFRFVAAVPTGSHGFSLTNCQHVTLDSCRVYASTGFAITEQDGEGANVYRHCVVGRKPDTDRLLGGTRDAFHSYRMRRGPTIEDCDLSYVGDDLIAIHGFFDIVEQQPAPDHVVLVAPFGSDVDPGVKIQFCDFQTTEPRGQAVVLSASKIEGDDAKARIRALHGAMVGQHFPVRDFPANLAELIDVKLDRPVQTAQFTIAGNPGFCGSGAVIRGNYLHDNNSRGVIVKACDVTIANNKMERLGSPGVAVVPESYFLEGPFVSNILIKNNTIVDCNAISYNDRYMEPTIGAIQISDLFGRRLFNPPTFNGYSLNSNIVIDGNHIIRPGVFAIMAFDTSNLTITNNVIEQPHQRRAWIGRLNLAGVVKDAGGPSSVAPEALDVLAHPLYASLLLGDAGVVLHDNKVTSDLPGYRGDWGIGPWVSGLMGLGKQ